MLLDLLAALLDAWASYIEWLEERPLETKALTSAGVAGLSDVITQLIVRKRAGAVASGFKWRRTLILVLYGGVYTGPAAHFWQECLEFLFHGQNDIWSVLQKVLIDQTTYGPFCNVLFLAFATVVIEGKSVHLLNTKVRRDFPRVQLQGWKVWPLAALINYRFVPLQFRVLFINVVALCWTVFLLLRARQLAMSSQSAAAMHPAPGVAGGAGSAATAHAAIKGGAVAVQVIAEPADANGALEDDVEHKVE